MPQSRIIRLLPLATASLATLLGACGGDPGPTSKVIYTSSSDCADGALIDFDKCARAIDKAIAEHDKSSPKYVTLGDCEKAEGNDRCEKVVDRQYRPRLMGYLFTINSQKQTAVPLYAGLKGAPVFRAADGTVYDQERTEGVKFSREAKIKSAGFVPDKRRGRG